MQHTHTKKMTRNTNIHNIRMFHSTEHLNNRITSPHKEILPIRIKETEIRQASFAKRCSSHCSHLMNVVLRFVRVDVNAVSFWKYWYFYDRIRSFSIKMILEQVHYILIRALMRSKKILSEIHMPTTWLHEFITK